MHATALDVTNMPEFSTDEAMRLQAAELERTLSMLRTLDAAQWHVQTDCPDWDVHRMYLHVLGACEAAASMREGAHQMIAGKRHQKANGGPLEAGLSAVQVADRLDIGPDDLLDRLAAVAPVTVRKRAGMPRIVRRFTMKVDGPVAETWRLGYLLDTIYLRDLWMHRVDAARATGAALELDAQHDGRIVADVVAEWSRRHRSPFSLTLTGPAGGEFVSGGGGDAPSASTELPEMDAVEFCRTLASRLPGEGLLSTVVPF